jgi:hypothetical protein
MRILRPFTKTKPLIIEEVEIILVSGVIEHPYLKSKDQTINLK